MANYNAILKKLLYKYKFKCVKCGNNNKPDLSIDHIIPISKGGSDNFDNLQILCKKCNSNNCFV